MSDYEVKVWKKLKKIEATVEEVKSAIDILIADKAGLVRDSDKKSTKETTKETTKDKPKLRDLPKEDRPSNWNHRIEGLNDKTLWYLYFKKKEVLHKIIKSETNKENILKHRKEVITFVKAMKKIKQGLGE